MRHLWWTVLFCTTSALATDVVVSSIEGVSVWLRSPNGEFRSTEQNLSTERFNAGGALADLDGDGDLDWFGVTFNTEPHQVWFNSGAGRFLPSEQIFGGEYWNWGVVLGDVDGDHDVDAFVSNPIGPDACPPNELWRNKGRGQFELTQKLGAGCSQSAAFSDVDGDGDLDIVTADARLQDHARAGPSSNTVWFNNGAGRFRAGKQRLVHEQLSGGVALADLDGDRDPDVFLANSGADTVWRNDGRGRFTDSGQRLGNDPSFAVALADLDGDADIDAFVANAGYEGAKVWLNSGSGAFEDSGQSLGDQHALDVVLVDIDDDGDSDAIIANRHSATDHSAGHVQVWLNDGRAHFTLGNATLGVGRHRKIAVGVLQ